MGRDDASNDSQTAMTGTGNTAPALTTTTVLTFLWAIVSYGIRLYVKLRKADKWAADDVAITVAIVAALGQVVAVCHSVDRGYGNPWSTLSTVDRTAAAKSLYASQILYILSIAATKISIGLFTANVLTRDPRNIKIAQWSLIPSVMWAIAATTAVAVRGNMSEPWETLNHSQTMFLRWASIEATGFGIDIAAAALTAYFVQGLQMSIAKKIAVFAILNCRLLLVLPQAFRLYYLSPSIDVLNDTVSDIVTEVVMNTAIIFASVTCLKPFLRPFDPIAFGASGSHTGLFRYTTEHQDSQVRSSRYYELSGARSAKAGRKEPSSKIRETGDGSRGEDEDELPLRPGGNMYVSRAQADRRLHAGNEDQGNSKAISKTQSWTVTSSVG